MSKGSGWAELKTDFKWVSALALVFVLVGPILFHYASPIVGPLTGRDIPDPWPAWAEPTDGEEDLGNVTDALFSTGEYADGAKDGPVAQPGLVAPFEVLSVLLLAALIAGVVIALREKEGDA